MCLVDLFQVAFVAFLYEIVPARGPRRADVMSPANDCSRSLQSNFSLLAGEFWRHAWVIPSSASDAPD